MARCWVHLLLPRIELITQKRKYLLITNWGEIKTAKSFLKPQASGEARTSIAYFSFSSSSSSSPILLEMTAAGSDACQWGEVPVNFLLRLIEIRDCLIIRIGLGKRDSIDCCWTQGPGEVKKKKAARMDVSRLRTRCKGFYRRKNEMLVSSPIHRARRLLLLDARRAMCQLG